MNSKEFATAAIGKRVSFKAFDTSFTGNVCAYVKTASALVVVALDQGPSECIPAACVQFDKNRRRGYPALAGCGHGDRDFGDPTGLLLRHHSHRPPDCTERSFDDHNELLPPQMWGLRCARTIPVHQRRLLGQVRSAAAMSMK